MPLERDVKEFIRDSITRLGLSRTHLRIRKATGQNVDHLFRPTLAERFSAIYQNRVWLNDRPSGSLSGLGSELVNTDRVRQALQPLLIELNTRTLLDVGCGDFLWMKELNLDCQYIGIDVVEDVIAANDSAYASETRIFQKLDATIDALPKADTVLCREVLFHLSFADIWRVLTNIKRSQAVFLIATNDPGLRYNADIVSGDFRLLNLQSAPFHLPSPNRSIPDDRLSPGRTLSVWKISELANLIDAKFG
jgi:2-polyprenyl-3-methyl-5-hydroxy-6-metoxy-1,4-benzoquinol methylase